MSNKLTIFKYNYVIPFLLVFLLCGCSTKFSTIESDQNTVLYKLDEDNAFKIAHKSMLSVLPGRKITIIDGPTKGYSTTFRFVLDTYSQQILVFRASGNDPKGNKVFGYYYEVSGSGSSFVQGRSKNVKLYDTLTDNLKSTNSAVSVSNVKNETYITASRNKASQTSKTAQSPKDEIFLNLERLKDLYDKGILTEEEYKKEKEELLDKL